MVLTNVRNWRHRTPPPRFWPKESHDPIHTVLLSRWLLSSFTPLPLLFSVPQRYKTQSRNTPRCKINQAIEKNFCKNLKVVLHLRHWCIRRLMRMRGLRRLLKAGRSATSRRSAPATNIPNLLWCLWLKYSQAQTSLCHLICPMSNPRLIRTALPSL